MVEKGYFMIPRRIFVDSKFSPRDEYSRMEAIIDLYQMARFEPGKASCGKSGKYIDIERGELVASFGFLAERWGWKRPRVVRFLGYLSKIGLSSQRVVNGITVVKMEDCTKVDNTLPDGMGNTATGTAAKTAHGLKTKQLDSASDTAGDTANGNNKNKGIKEVKTEEILHTHGAHGENSEKAMDDSVYASELRNSRQALERIAMGQRMSVAEVEERLDVFANEMEATAQSHRNRADYRRHFYNWLRLGREIGRRNALAEKRLGQHRMTKEEANRMVMQRCMDNIATSIAAAEHDEEARRFRMEVLGRKE